VDPRTATLVADDLIDVKDSLGKWEPAIVTETNVNEVTAPRPLRVCELVARAGTAICHRVPCQLIAAMLLTLFDGANAFRSVCTTWTGMRGTMNGFLAARLGWPRLLLRRSVKSPTRKARYANSYRMHRRGVCVVTPCTRITTVNRFCIRSTGSDNVHSLR